jgi:iron complex outermembrane receptor protein
LKDLKTPEWCKRNTRGCEVNPTAKRMTATTNACIASAISLILLSTELPGEEARARAISYQLDIPAENLDTALQALALASNHKLLYRAELVIGKTNHAIRGTFTTEQAMRELLGGTGLEFEITPASVVLIKHTGEAEPGEVKALVMPPPTSQSSVPSGAMPSDDSGRASSNISPGKPAEPTSPHESSALNEIVVTANRRKEKLEDVPYAVTVVTADQIRQSGVTDIASLTYQVPGLSQFDLGARASASVTPIIRGLNASSPSTLLRNFQQSAVGSYMGNSPVDGYFQLDDISRIEVLRGPQGTLYGAGALGGAIRIILNDPQLDTYSINVDASGGAVDHSSGIAYSTSAMVNIPLGDTFALRLSGKYQYAPGFIDATGILQRSGPFLTAVPTLDDPSDPINSSGIQTTEKDWNRQDTLTGRASVLWQPSDVFRADLSVMYSDLNGTGAPTVNSGYPGGTDPWDPTVTHSAIGDYQYFTRVDQPYWRHTSLTSLDTSYDVGFATLSSTSSYSTNVGSTESDISLLGALPFYASYYAGNPVNPRYIGTQQFDDSTHVFSQEVRLVSNATRGKAIDYVAGLFYQKRQSDGSWTVTSPGTYQRAVQQGCTSNYFLGASFPDCLLPTGASNLNWYQPDAQAFTDKSLFGELTWHLTQNGQITFGGRHFIQNFSDSQSIVNPTFSTIVPASPASQRASKNTWKVNPSYEYVPSHSVYALWSQGFRRGGANSIPLSGEFAASPALQQYSSDTVNNYELGLKGRFESKLRYTLTVFDDEWKDPQINGSTALGDLLVYNGVKARSRGLEFDATGPLFLDGLSYTIGGAYVDAKLTESFSLPSGIVGVAGWQLPGSPKTSLAATLNYDRPIAPDYLLSLALNGTYRDRAPLKFPTSTTAAVSSSPFGIVNGSAMVTHGSWRYGVYGTNLADRRAVLESALVYSQFTPDVGRLIYPSVINRPREVGIRLSYSF